MADDNLIQAALGALEGFGRVYIPYKQRQQEDFLTQQAEQRKYDRDLLLLQQKNAMDVENEKSKRIYEQTKADRENLISPEQLPENLRVGLGVTGNIRKEAVAPAASLISSKGRNENTYSYRDNLMDERRSRAILQYSEQMLNNPIIKEMKKQNISLDSVNEMVNLASKGNTVASSAMGTKAARAMGEVGVLTDVDVSRYVKSGQLDRKAADILSSWIKGRPTDATLKEISQIMTVLKDIHEKKIQPEYDSYVNRVARNFKISEEEAAYLMDIQYTGTSKNKPINQGTVSQSGLTTEQKRARVAELRQKLMGGK